MEDLPGPWDRKMGAELGAELNLLQVKRVVCVHHLVMALHKRRGLWVRLGWKGGAGVKWLSKGSLRMFKMLVPMSWSITGRRVGAFKGLCRV